MTRLRGLAIAYACWLVVAYAVWRRWAAGPVYGHGRRYGALRADLRAWWTRRRNRTVRPSTTPSRASERPSTRNGATT